MATAKRRRSTELKKLGKRAKFAREQIGYGLREAAEAADLDSSSLSRLEAGERLVDLDGLVRLTELYNVTLDWLVANRGPGPLPSRGNNGEDSPRPPPVGDRRRRFVDDKG
jgi:transcriptional regulator with XRE-family HTH domain